MKVRVGLAVALVLVMGGLWWVGRESPPAAVAPTSVSAPSTPALVGSTPAGGSEGSAVDELSNAERGQVVAFATKFADAFARPTAKADNRAWWKKVSSMLTDDAADDLLGIDPGQVPFTKVTGQVELAEGSDETYWMRQVRVPTNGGVYVLEVQLVTPGLSDRLLISGIEAP